MALLDQPSPTRKESSTSGGSPAQCSRDGFRVQPMRSDGELLEVFSDISLSAFLLEGSGHSASLQVPSVIETLFIRKGGVDVGCSRICPPLLWLS